MLAALVLLLAVTVVRTAVVGPVRVDGDSMAPTVERGAVVLVERLGPGLVPVRRGDVVMFTSPVDGAETIKRVVGVAGDTVVTLDAVLFVNGASVAEPYVDRESIDGLYTPRVEVPQGQVYVLGDRRANSIDSRTYGTVPLDTVEGHVVAQLWSPAWW